MPLEMWDLKTIIILFITCACSVSLLSISEKKRKSGDFRRSFVFYLASLTIVIGVAGLQQSNSDLLSYFDLYDNIDLSKGFILHEVGFKIIVYILHTTGFNAQALFLTMALITYTFSFSALTYYSRKLEIPIAQMSIVFLAIYFLPSFGMLRQMVAASIMFFSLRFIGEKNPLKFIGLTVLATSFHVTALFGGALYVFYRLLIPVVDSYFFTESGFRETRKPRQMTHILLTLGWVVVIYLAIYLLPWMLSKINLGRDYTSQLQPSRIGFGFAIQIPIVFAILKLMKFDTKPSHDIAALSIVILFHSSLAIAYYRIPALTGRLQYYVLCCYSILIPYYAQRYLSKRGRWGLWFVRAMVVLGAILYVFFMLLRTPWITKYLMPLRFAL